MSSEKNKGFWSTGRLVIGIICCILPLIIMLQSCAAGMVNAMSENGSSSGSQGVMTALCMLVAGIVGICTRNAKKKAGPIVAAVFYLLALICTLGSGATYGDLPIWGGLCGGFAVVFIIAAVKTGKEA